MAQRGEGFKVLTLTLLLFFAALWGGIVRDDFMVNDDTLSGSPQEWHSSAAIVGDQFIIVMTDERDGYNIYAQIYDENANPSGGNFKISNSYSLYNSHPEIYGLSNGSLVAVWTRHPFSNEWVVTARYFTSTGLPLTEDFDVSSSSSLNELDPDVAASPSSVLFTWWDGDEAQVYGRLYDLEGNPLTDDFLISDAPGENRYPAVAYGGDGFFLVAYINSLSDSENFLMARIIDVSGNPVGPSFPISNTPTCGNGHYIHSVSGDDNGFAISWYDTRMGGDIYLRLVDASGNPFESEVRVTTVSGTSYYNSVALSDSFVFVAFWDMRDDSETTFQGDIKGDIWGRVFTRVGLPVSDEFKVNTDSPGAQQRQTSVAAIGNRFLVSFMDMRNLNADIYARLYEGATPLGPDFLVPDDTGTAKQCFPSCDANANDNFVVAFADDRNGTNSDIYVSFIGPLGEFLTPNINVIQGDTWGDPQCYPDVAMNNDGRAVVVWINLGHLGNRIEAQILDEDYQLHGPNLYIADLVLPKDRDPAAYRPSVSIRADGSFVVTWAAGTGKGKTPHYIVAQLFDPDGLPLGDPFRVSDATGSFTETHPTVAMNDDGYFVVSWVEERSGLHTPYVRLFDPDGTPITPCIAVDSPRNEIVEVSCSIDSTCRFVAGWMWSFGQIYGKIYDSSGNVTAGPFNVVEYDSSYNQNICVTMSSSGNIAFFWTNYNTDPLGETWTQYFDIEGNMLGNNTKINDDGIGQYQTSRPFGCAASPNEIIFVWEDTRRVAQGPDVFAQINDWAGQQAASEDINITLKPFVRVFPNPARGPVTIAFSKPISAPLTISVYDASGRKIVNLLSLSDNSLLSSATFDLSWLPRGIYFISVKNGSRSTVERLELLR